MECERNRPGSATAYRAAVVAVLVIFGALMVLGVATPGIAQASSPPCNVKVYSENAAHDAIQTGDRYISREE